jgi:hypothetical protein
MCWYFIIDVICVHPDNKNALNIITTVDWHLSIWYVFFVLKFWYILFFKSVLDRFDTLCIYPACKRLNAFRTIDKINDLTLFWLYVPSYIYILKLYKLWCIFNHNCTSYNLYSNNWTSYNLYDGVIQVITCINILYKL